MRPGGPGNNKNWNALNKRKEARPGKNPRKDQYAFSSPRFIYFFLSSAFMIDGWRLYLGFMYNEVPYAIEDDLRTDAKPQHTIWTNARKD